MVSVLLHHQNQILTECYAYQCECTPTVSPGFRAQLRLSQPPSLSPSRFKAITKARLLEVQPGSALPASGLGAEPCTSLLVLEQSSESPQGVLDILASSPLLEDPWASVMSSLTFILISVIISTAFQIV